MISHQQRMYFLLTIFRSLLLPRDPSSQRLCYMHVSLGLLIVLGIVVRFLHLIPVHLFASEFHCVFIHFKQTSYGLIRQGWFEGYQKIKIIFTNQDLAAATIWKAVTPRQWRETNRLRKIRPVLPVRCECVYLFLWLGWQSTMCYIRYTGFGLAAQLEWDSKRVTTKIYTVQIVLCYCTHYRHLIDDKSLAPSDSVSIFASWLHFSADSEHAKFTALPWMI